MHCAGNQGAGELTGKVLIPRVRCVSTWHRCVPECPLAFSTQLGDRRAGRKQAARLSRLSRGALRVRHVRLHGRNRAIAQPTVPFNLPGRPHVLPKDSLSVKGDLVASKGSVEEPCIPHRSRRRFPARVHHLLCISISPRE